MNQPTFSIVVPSYNYAHFLPHALDSVLAQGRDDLQIIVIDDASQDETPQVAARYTPHIEYYRNEQNLGAGGAWSRGIAKATGKYVMKLDADDQLLPGHLNAFERAFEAHPEIGMVFSSVVIKHERYGSSWPEILTAKNQLLSAPDFRKLLLSRFFFRMPGCAVRGAALAGHALPDPALFQIHDWEYFLRVTQGWGAFLIHEPLAIYRVHEASITSLATFQNRIQNDFRYWIQIASEPGERHLEKSERDRLKGSFAIVLVFNRYGTKWNPLTYLRLSKAYLSGSRLALAGGFGEVARMNYALLQRMLPRLLRNQAKVPMQESSREPSSETS